MSGSTGKGKGEDSLSQVQRQSMGFDGERPKELYRTGSRENINTDEDSLQDRPEGKHLFRDPTVH